MDLFEKIKTLRIERKLSQKEMADFLGISQAAYAKIERPVDRDAKKISIEYGKIISKALGVSFNELFEIESPVNSDLKELTNEIEKLNKENQRLSDRITDQSNYITILKESYDISIKYRIAYLQERTINELMIPATLEISKELHEKGEKIELKSSEIRKRAIELYQRDFPDIPLNPFINLTPAELPKK